jgi:hypothetical protein
LAAPEDAIRVEVVLAANRASRAAQDEGTSNA